MTRLSLIGLGGGLPARPLRPPRLAGDAGADRLGRRPLPWCRAEGHGQGTAAFLSSGTLGHAVFSTRPIK